ncbi:hypothetical protein PHLCEN_2v4774 [Hermanssonia centrifuga]|uniref:Uncharacterized protein n=1 Tax=Hermanssonia centrifuga TaxID=98765 RepID=A0A2R6PJF4_9APHY|nr:hypothetical protein PHLCEN_2v4774 [Hermanssonia centrifuga]
MPRMRTDQRRKRLRVYVDENGSPRVKHTAGPPKPYLKPCTVKTSRNKSNKENIPPGYYDSDQIMSSAGATDRSPFLRQFSPQLLSPMAPTSPFRQFIATPRQAERLRRHRELLITEHVSDSEPERARIRQTVITYQRNQLRLLDSALLDHKSPRLSIEKSPANQVTEEPAEESACITHSPKARANSLTSTVQTTPNEAVVPRQRLPRWNECDAEFPESRRVYYRRSRTSWHKWRYTFDTYEDYRASRIADGTIAIDSGEEIYSEE